MLEFVSRVKKFINGRLDVAVGPGRRLKRLERTIGEKWEKVDHSGGPALLKRSYADYRSYLDHQRLKLDVFLKNKPQWLKKYDKKYRVTLSARLAVSGIPLSGKKVLCLGARLGTEVKAFLDHGAFAVGIDLNPGKLNRYVLHGDFHALQFADRSVDIVFTNAIDHVFDLDRFLSELGRVLVANGVFMLEAVQGERVRKSGFYESFWWSDVAEIIPLVEKAGFKAVRREPIDYPWVGERIQFERSSVPEKNIIAP